MFKNKILTSYLWAFLCCLLILVACNDPTNVSDPSADESVTTNESQVQVIEDPTLPETVLQKWDEGEDVENVQHILNELSYKVESFGTFDEYTTWAITDIQLQAEDIIPTGVYNEDTRKFMETLLDEENSITPEEGLALPSDAYLYKHDSETVENPYDVLALVNKEHALPGDYTPEDLVIPNVRYPFTDDLPKKQLRKIAADALEELFEASDEAGLELYAQSGYRSYDRQESIFTSNIEQHGEEEANNFSARPGQSEHQSGLTMDVTSPSVGFRLEISFGETPEGTWLMDHAHEHGFIIRYPEGKEDITQYQYEPWHLRYVGVKVATKIYEDQITLEEYIEQQTN